MYAIKIIYDATPANPNFYPCHAEYLRAKNTTICIEDTNCKHVWSQPWTFENARRYINGWKYGYINPHAALAAAQRSAEEETKDGFWSVRCEIVNLA